LQTTLLPLPLHTSPGWQQIVLAPLPQHDPPAGQQMELAPEPQHNSPALQQIFLLQQNIPVPQSPSFLQLSAA